MQVQVVAAKEQVDCRSSWKEMNPIQQRYAGPTDLSLSFCLKRGLLVKLTARILLCC